MNILKRKITFEGVKNFSIILGGLSLFLILVLVVLATIVASNSPSSFENVITVVGKGEKQMQLEKLNYEITVESFGATEQAAENNINVLKKAWTTKMINLLNLNEYAVNDLQVGEIYVGESRYSTGGWMSSFVIVFSLDDLNQKDQLWKDLTALTDRGVIINKPKGVYTEPSKEDLDEIYELAVNDAKSKAARMAAGAGKKLGKVVSVEEGVSIISAPSPGELEASCPEEDEGSVACKLVTVKYRIK